MTPEQDKIINDRLNEFTLQLSEHLAQTVQGAIKLHVNGKIDSLRNSFEEHKGDDLKWKERAEPMIRTYENTGWIWGKFVQILIFFGVLTGAIYGVFQVITQIILKK